MGLSRTIIYTSELILCSTICVPSATRHNIHMYPYFLFAAIHHLNRPRLSLCDLVAQSVACLQAVTHTGGFIAENPFRSVIERHLGFLRRALPGTTGRAQKSREGEGEGREEKNRLLENQLPLSSSPATMALPPT